MTASGKYSVLFVCLGNICRSPAAQAVMQRMVDERGLTERFYIDSAGIGGWHIGDLPDKRMRVHARPRGYELSHRARRVQSSDFDDFDLIVGMDAANVDDLCHMAFTLEQQNKVVMMGDYIRQYPNYDYVPDPYYEGSEGFELVLDLLEDSCDNLLNQIIEQNNISK
ncbi:MAG: low molecular weight phosphotyrosine protein phosphatase [Muribaculaceae bacterium]|nr:low molecular weight phosphotyrosine protein phosphatase [Muribaculaceae bacterium]MBR5685419.1 low molecular weight phosphotyrosine protein phosphatase [Muribaculaceae bacterium]